MIIETPFMSKAYNLSKVASYQVALRFYFQPENIIQDCDFEWALVSTTSHFLYARTSDFILQKWFGLITLRKDHNDDPQVRSVPNEELWKFSLDMYGCL